MTILKQNAIDIYAATDISSVVICEEEGFFNERNGSNEDVFIHIDIAHIDTVIEALQKAKKEILDRQNKNN